MKEIIDDLTDEETEDVIAIALRKFGNDILKDAPSLSFKEQIFFLSTQMGINISHLLRELRSTHRINDKTTASDIIRQIGRLDRKEQDELYKQLKGEFGKINGVSKMKVHQRITVYVQRNRDKRPIIRSLIDGIKQDTKRLEKVKRVESIQIVSSLGKIIEIIKKFSPDKSISELEKDGLFKLYRDNGIPEAIAIEELTYAKLDLERLFRTVKGILQTKNPKLRRSILDHLSTKYVDHNHQTLVAINDVKAHRIELITYGVMMHIYLLFQKTEDVVFLDDEFYKIEHVVYEKISEIISEHGNPISAGKLRSKYITFEMVSEALILDCFPWRI